MALVKTIIDNNEIEYDDKEFEVLKEPGNVYLHYIGSGKNVANPKGNTSCYSMFHDYKGTSLDLTNFDTHNITNMSCMFVNCSNLSYLNLSNFDTHNVIDMSSMFSYCKSIKHLNLSNFDTNKVISMRSMFYNCENLKLLNISQFNTENVINMEDMFNKCKNLTELDLSSFHINDTTRLNDMFLNCEGLETLKVSSDCLQFFSMNRVLLEIGNNVNIIPASKLDKAVEDLFY